MPSGRLTVVWQGFRRFRTRNREFPIGSAITAATVLTPRAGGWKTLGQLPLLMATTLKGYRTA
jgi:hypothetical protein